MMKNIVLTLLATIFCLGAFAQPDTISITLDNVAYPYPVKFLPVNTDEQDLRMAYMDVQPTKNANGKTVMLFHGKNFGGYYWTNVIKALTSKGYRVVVPDQLGFGKSSKAFIHYSFYKMARLNKKLLDTLGVKKAYVLGHSMGGMLATRFTLMYPGTVEKLLLENPIGLEDYLSFVPYKSAEELYKSELKTTAESVKKYYQTSYFDEWKPEYDYLVKIGGNVSKSADFPRYAMVSALTYEMIFEQPVCHEFSNIKVPTVLFIGLEDNTIVGKAYLSPEEQAKHGNYKKLAPETAKKIPGAKLISYPGVKHVPHWQIPEQFLKDLINNL